MNKNASTSSFGGTWGSETKLSLTFGGEMPKDPEVVDGFTSVSRATYTLDPFVKSKNQNQSKFHRFVSYIFRCTRIFCSQ
jgi:hypothetical protein